MTLHVRTELRVIALELGGFATLIECKRYARLQHPEVTDHRAFRHLLDAEIDMLSRRAQMTRDEYPGHLSLARWIFRHHFGLNRPEQHRQALLGYFSRRLLVDVSAVQMVQVLELLRDNLCTDRYSTLEYIEMMREVLKSGRQQRQQIAAARRAASRRRHLSTGRHSDPIARRRLRSQPLTGQVIPFRAITVVEDHDLAA